MNEPLISFKNISKKYGDKVVLDNINFDIFNGQIIGYIGPNGAGKSTTVKILTGIIQDYEGIVLYKGVDIREDIIALKKRIGYAPEVAELYDLLSPREYLNFVGSLYQLPTNIIKDRSENILKSLGLLEQIDQRMDTFSKGMRQKVLLTSSILHNPEILILDEPMSGLDANAIIVLKELIQAFKLEGKTIFYCSHMMDVVEKVSDKIILLNKGCIVANDTIENLREHNNASLENIFASLTTSDNLSATAQNIIDAIRE